MSLEKPKKWETVKEIDSQSLLIFNYRKLVRRHPEWNIEGHFTVLESNDWVNIIPITKEGNIVLIEQYRHGTDSIVLEIPGGLIEIGEIPVNAAKRECIEETGYSSKEELEFLGEVQPNPAFQTNKCYTYLWKDCELLHDQNLDSHEDIVVKEFPENEINNMILSGRIKHGVVLNALMFYLMRKKV